MAYRRTEQISHRLAARRAAILAAARDNVAARGFQALSMQHVADAAGVAIGTLYRYFPSKDSLCSEIVAAISDRELALLREIAVSDGRPLDRLWRAVAEFSGRALRAPQLAYALMAEPVGPALDEMRIRYRAALARVIADLIREGVSAGALPPQDAGAAAAFMVGAFIEGVIGPHAPKLPGGDRANLADAIASFCVRGAGARARDLAGVERRHAGAARANRQKSHRA